MGDCRKCIHTYKTKILLNTLEEWDQMLKDSQYKGVKTIEFKYEEYTLYLEEIKEHDCNAGRWNYVTLRDTIFWKINTKWRMTIPQLKDILRNYDSYYKKLHAEISVHWDDRTKHEHFFAGVTKIEKQKSKLIIYIKKLS